MRRSKNNPLFKLLNNYLVDAWHPSNLSYMWNFGSLLALCLGIQIITGTTLAMHYNPSVLEAFNSVEHIMRDVNNGWLIRYLHSNTASAFFFLVYLHISRGLYYGSYKAPRTLVWTIGTVIFILMMATAFLGYVLPYGQMSLWGATVITNLMSAIPWVGQDIVEFIWGGFSVNNATLNKFFSLHFVLPFVLAALVLMHLIALHDTGFVWDVTIFRSPPKAYRFQSSYSQSSFASIIYKKLTLKKILIAIMVSTILAVLRYLFYSGIKLDEYSLRDWISLGLLGLAARYLSEAYIEHLTETCGPIKISPGSGTDKLGYGPLLMNAGGPSGGQGSGEGQGQGTGQGEKRKRDHWDIILGEPKRQMTQAPKPAPAPPQEEPQPVPAPPREEPKPAPKFVPGPVLKEDESMMIPWDIPEHKPVPANRSGIRDVGHIGSVHERGFLVKGRYFSDYISVVFLNDSQRVQIKGGWKAPGEGSNQPAAKNLALMFQDMLDNKAGKRDITLNDELRNCMPGFKDYLNKADPYIRSLKDPPITEGLINKLRDSH